jgi:hypothetical protein
VWLVVCKTISEQECMILITLYLVGVENTDSWLVRKTDLHQAFPLNVPMVPSSAITVVADGERLMCGQFSLSETVCLGNFEFITDYFDSLSLSPWRGDAGTAFMGSTHSGAPSLQWAMIEDSVEEFLTMLCGEGSFSLPSPRRCSTRASPAPITTTQWIEDALTAQATTTVPL